MRQEPSCTWVHAVDGPPRVGKEAEVTDRPSSYSSGGRSQWTASDLSLDVAEFLDSLEAVSLQGMCDDSGQAFRERGKDSNENGCS